MYFISKGNGAFWTINDLKGIDNVAIWQTPCKERSNLNVWEWESILLWVCEHVRLSNPRVDRCVRWGQAWDYRIHESFAPNHCMSIVVKISSALISLHGSHWVFICRLTYTHHDTYTHTHKVTMVFPWRCTVAGERVSVCSPVLPSAVSTHLSPSSPPPFYHAIHRLLPLGFFFCSRLFLKPKYIKYRETLL